MTTAWNDNLTDIPMGLEDPYRLKRPDEERWVIDSNDLANGFIVLLGQPAELRTIWHNQEELDALVQSYGLIAKLNAFERNRWCRVHKLFYYDDSVAFVGVYGDGSQLYRRYPINTPWIVKLSSIPESQHAEFNI